MNCTQLISNAFAVAAQHGRPIYERWIRASISLGGRLPDSLLILSIQRLGKLDLLLRRMEDEFKVQDADTLDADQTQVEIMATMAELWIGSAYEIFRLAVEREIITSNLDFELIAEHLRLIRIPLEKHEIANGPMPGGSIDLQRHPPNNNESDAVLYEKTSKTRSHIMPTSVSNRGSMMWHVIDLKTNSSFWLERRSLADRILDVLTSGADKHVASVKS